MSEEHASQQGVKNKPNGVKRPGKSSQHSIVPHHQYPRCVAPLVLFEDMRASRKRVHLVPHQAQFISRLHGLEGVSPCERWRMICDWRPHRVIKVSLLQVSLYPTVPVLSWIFLVFINAV